MAVLGPLELYAGSHDLRDPVLIVAYAGWSDGGDAATTALRHLMARLSVARFATLDTEDYLDFTVVRPHVRSRDDGPREIVWPNHEFFAARMEDQSRDLILGLGVEPHLRWKSYARSMVELTRMSRATLVITLGAFLDDVIYSQPVQVGAFSADEAIVERYELGPSRYEGPTGIVGVLGDAFRQEDIPSLSLWARIPHYVQNKPNARAALALIQVVESITSLRFEKQSLETEANEFDRTVSEAIAADPQLSAYVRELKRRAFSTS